MSYNSKVNWKDRVVQYPRTYSETVNQNGTKTFAPAPGTVTQEGTPQNAANFNKMDEALQHLSVAFDMMLTMFQAEIRDLQDRVTTLESENGPVIVPIGPIGDELT